MGMMRCSVVILNWNGVNMLKRYLPSVIRYTTLPDVEIVVADNGSTDESLAFLTNFPLIRIITLGRNYGFAEGYNRAIEQIDSQYVVLLNSDVEVTEGWLDSLMEYLDEHPGVVAVQPKILSWLSKEEHLSDGADISFEYAGAAGGMMDVLGYPYCRGRLLDKVELDKGQYEVATPVFWTSGACMIIKTEIYKKVGGLDNSFFAHMEEIDLCWRLNSRGYQTYYIPTSKVYHLGGGSLPYHNPKKTFFNFRNNQMMLFKNLPLHHYLIVFPLRLVLDYLSFTIFIFRGQIRDAFAVMKGRLSFWKNITQLRSKRRLNLDKTVVNFIPTMSIRSIVFDYYIRNKTN